MLKIIAIVAAILVAAVVGVFAYAATMPNTFRVARSTTIKAPPEAIMPLITDFHRWTAWSPYENLDPAMTRSYSGAPSGPGAVYAWSSDGKAGKGQMRIVDVSAPTKVTIALDFTQPFEAHNTVTYSLEPRGDATTVSWIMDGPMPLVAKVMSMFFNMDKMIGGDFETGLANLKAQAEHPAKAA